MLDQIFFHSQHSSLPPYGKGPAGHAVGAVQEAKVQHRGVRGITTAEKCRPLWQLCGKLRVSAATSVAHCSSFGPCCSKLWLSKAAGSSELRTWQLVCVVHITNLRRSSITCEHNTPVPTKRTMG